MAEKVKSDAELATIEDLQDCGRNFAHVLAFLNRSLAQQLLHALDTLIAFHKSKGAHTREARIPLRMIPAIMDSHLADIDAAAVDMNEAKLTVPVLQSMHSHLIMPDEKTSHPDLIVYHCTPCPIHRHTEASLLFDAVPFSAMPSHSCACRWSPLAMELMEEHEHRPQAPSSASSGHQDKDKSSNKSKGGSPRDEQSSEAKRKTHNRKPGEVDEAGFYRAKACNWRHNDKIRTARWLPTKAAKELTALNGDYTSICLAYHSARGCAGDCGLSHPVPRIKRKEWQKCNFALAYLVGEHGGPWYDSCKALEPAVIESKVLELLDSFDPADRKHETTQRRGGKEFIPPAPLAPPVADSAHAEPRAGSVQGSPLGEKRGTTFKHNYAHENRYDTLGDEGSLAQFNAARARVFASSHDVPDRALLGEMKVVGSAAHSLYLAPLAHEQACCIQFTVLDGGEDTVGYGDPDANTRACVAISASGALRVKGVDSTPGPLKFIQDQRQAARAWKAHHTDPSAVSSWELAAAFRDVAVEDEAILLHECECAQNLLALHQPNTPYVFACARHVNADNC